MQRGRVIFWSVSGAVIAAGLGAYLWLSFHRSQTKVPPAVGVQQLREAMLAKNDQPPAPWPSPNAWWKRATIDAYDQANAGKVWPSARRAVVAFAKDYAYDPGATDDEAEDGASAGATATEFGCTDPLVLFVYGNYQAWLAPDDPRAEAATALAQAADALPGSPYHPGLKAMGLLRAARVVAHAPARHNSPANPAKAVGYADAGVAAAAEAFADPELPASHAYRLVRDAGRASVALYKRRATLADKVLAALDQSKQPRTVALAARGEYLKDLAWDARGSGFAGTVTEAGWRGFAARLAESRAAYEQACDLDPANGFAAAEMINICTGEGADRTEMERWFKRALAADPGNDHACLQKLNYLEPKWHGSPLDMILFGRQLARAAANDPRAARLPLHLVNAHWTLGTYANGGGSDYPAPAYFADNEDAWTDVSKVYEAYLAKFPDARHHRTRYAVIAAWAGHPDVAAARFRQLGEQFSRRILPEPALRALRAQATSKTATN